MCIFVFNHSYAIFPRLSPALSLSYVEFDRMQIDNRKTDLGVNASDGMLCARQRER